MSAASPSLPLILSVDDLPHELATLERILRPVNGVLMRAGSAAEALALTSIHEFALILLDVHLPQMDGYALAEILRADPKTQRVPIIFVMDAHEPTPHAGYGAGAVDYAVRPFEPSKMLGKVQVFLELANYRKGVEQVVHERTQSLRANEEQHRTAIENAYDIIQHVRPDGSLAFVSASWERALGYSTADRRMLRAWDLIAPEARIEGGELLQSAFAGRLTTSLRTILMARDGRQIHVEGNFVPKRSNAGVDVVLCFFRDISDRIEAEDRLFLALETAEVCLWDWNLRSGDLSFTGRRVGVPDDPASDSPTATAEAFEALVHPEDRPRRQEALQRHFRGETDAYECELRLLRASDDWGWFLDRGRILARDEHGNPTRLVGTYVEISERKRAEEGRARLQVVEAESRAKGEFLARMSHELRTPMNAILGFSKLLLSESGLSTRQREHVGTIDRSGEHMLSLIESTLDLARIEAGRLVRIDVEFDPATLIAEVAQMFRLSAEDKRLLLRVHVAPDVPGLLLTDASKVRQVVINLLSNALKFTERGSIVVSVASRGLDADEVELSVAVEDTGAGIESHQQPLIFAACGQTAAGTRKLGLGLGLTVSRQLAEFLGGSLTVTSVPNVGSRFVFEFRSPRVGCAARKEPVELHSAVIEPPAPGSQPLPAALVDSLREAVEDGLPEAIEACNEQVEVLDPLLAATLRALARSYDYGRLLAVVAAIPSRGGAGDSAPSESRSAPSLNAV